MADPTHDKAQLLRFALREHMRSSVHLGRDVVDEIRFENFSFHQTFFLVLKTLFEHRRYRYLYRNWKGENLPESKPTQEDIWDIPVPVPKSFRDKEIDISLPNLDRIIDCGACEGRGMILCINCSGNGYLNQMGRLCSTCYGSGRNSCQVCQRMKKRIEGKALAVTFAAHKLTRGLGRGNLPKKELARVKIPPILQLQGTPIELPTTGDGYRQAHLLGDPRMKKALQSMLKKATPASGVRIAAQQQTVRRIPIVVANYRWSTERARVWLLGTSGCHHVYAPSPPFCMGRSERLHAEARSFLKGIMGLGSFLIGKKLHCKGCGRVMPIDPKHASEEQYCSEVCEVNYKRLTTDKTGSKSS